VTVIKAHLVAYTVTEQPKFSY